MTDSLVNYTTAIWTATPLKKNKLPDTRLIRRVQKIDKLEATKKKQLFQIIDTFIEADQLRQSN